MSRNFDQAWEALVAHFGAEQVNGITSSRRQFGAHLLPDLQATVVAEIGSVASVLLGVHQIYDQLPLTISSLLVRQGHLLILLEASHETVIEGPNAADLRIELHRDSTFRADDAGILGSEFQIVNRLMGDKRRRGRRDTRNPRGGKRSQQSERHRMSFPFPVAELRPCGAFG